jgi:hypothetical protein
MAPGGEAQEHARGDTEELARLCRTIVPELAEGRRAVDGNGNDVIVNARGRNVIASHTMCNAKLYARLKFDHPVPCPWKGHVEAIARTSSVDSVLLGDLRTPSYFEDNDSDVLQQPKVLLQSPKEQQTMYRRTLPGLREEGHCLLSL